MYHIYVLRSLKNGKRYVGLTRRTLQVRVREHEMGLSPWTRDNGPFELVYTETYEEKTEAQRRERFLKSGHGRELLSKLLIS